VEEVGDREYPMGWYFSDETEGLLGPFDTLEEAKQELEEYAEWLYMDEWDKIGGQK
jgi:hypothetical protein